MTPSREQVLRWAEQAHMGHYVGLGIVQAVDALTRFAALVVAEECARIHEENGQLAAAADVRARARKETPL